MFCFQWAAAWASVFFSDWATAVEWAERQVEDYGPLMSVTWAEI